MNGEQKFWALAVMTVAALLAWVAWNINDYHTHARTLEAESRPSAEETLACMNACTHSCLAETP